MVIMKSLAIILFDNMIAYSTVQFFFHFEVVFDTYVHLYFTTLKD